MYSARAVQRVERYIPRTSAAELADRGAPPLIPQPDEEVGRRKRQRRRGRGRRRPGRAQLHLYAIRRPRRGIALQGEPRAAQEERRGIAERLVPGLEIAGVPGW